MMQSNAKTRYFSLWTMMVLVVLVITLGLLELAGYLVIVQKGKNFYLPSALENIDDKTIPEETQKTFSAKLGWEHRHPNKDGYRGEAKNVQDAALAVFGDSYTQGHPTIEKSWPHLLERKLGHPVLNFGIGGYGPDQAFLRFEERYADKVETPYVALFVMAENIGRIVNRYRGFYVRRENVSFPKPMFYNDSGNIVLLPNPIQSMDEITKLGDMNFLREIGDKDYWFEYYGGYDLNEFAGFPYSYYLAKAFPFYSKTYLGRMRKTDEVYAYAALYDNERALEIMDFVLSSFATRAIELGAVPILGFLPAQENMEQFKKTGKAVYQDYVGDLTSRSETAIVDALDFFAPHIDRGDDPSSFFITDGTSNGHYNEKGETVVSDGVYQLIQRLDADRKLIGPGDEEVSQNVR